jgi:hypothetical protein
MSKIVGIQPWDEVPMRRALVRSLRRLPRVRLDLLTDLPSVPGCYLQFFAAPAVEPVLGKLVAGGQYPAYLGVASVSLRDRIGRYHQTIRGIEAVRAEDIHVAVLPCTSAASAHFAESAGIEELSPLLNGLGWGSKMPGLNRREQSPVDAIFPGRQWASPADPITQARVRLRVLSSLIQTDPSGPRWPALPVAGPAPVATVASSAPKPSCGGDRSER